MRISDCSSDVCASDLGNAYLDRLEPAISFEQYAAAFHHVKEAITAGDIYQANLTFPLRGRWRGDPIALYRTIRPEAKARFAALIFDGFDWLLSFSPELFFSLADRRINVRPRSEEHTSELQSLMRISYAVFCLKKNNNILTNNKI